MKRFTNLQILNLQIVVLLLAVVLSACNNGEAVYITEPTVIDLSISDNGLTASTIEMKVTPEDDRAYYYIECLSVDTLNKYLSRSTPKDFMMLTMDRVYIDYLIWRYDLLIEGETYIAPFSSHCLKYGVQNVHFTALEPMSDYVVFAFCVNPISNQPMGELYTYYFTTDSLRKVSLTFQFKLEQSVLYIMPSNDKDYYIADIIEKEVYKNNYNSDPIAYMSSCINYAKEYQFLDFYLRKNAIQIDISYTAPNTHYVLAATAYDGGISSDVATQEIYCDPDGIPHLVGGN